MPQVAESVPAADVRGLGPEHAPRSCSRAFEGERQQPARSVVAAAPASLPSLGLVPGSSVLRILAPGYRRRRERAARYRRAERTHPPSPRRATAWSARAERLPAARGPLALHRAMIEIDRLSKSFGP